MPYEDRLVTGKRGDEHDGNTQQVISQVCVLFRGSGARWLEGRREAELRLHGKRKASDAGVHISTAQPVPCCGWKDRRLIQGCQLGLFFTSNSWKCLPNRRTKAGPYLGLKRV